MNKAKKQVTAALLSFLLLFSMAIPTFANQHESKPVSTKKQSPSYVDLVDQKATSQTKSLFAYLESVRGNSILFGHQHATTEGSTLSVNDGTESEVNNAVGDFPAVYGWDTLSLEGKEKPGKWEGAQAENRDALINVMRIAYEKGGVLNLSAHMPNFVTGGSFYDTTGNVVTHILPGGAKNQEFKEYLDMIANFANNIKDNQGNAIPVVFRPFHEQNGSWFWWGAAFTTPAQYKEIYRYTVEYLRDKKQVRNFLYAFSPGSPFNNDEAKYLTTYPGDDYVDILGFDTYNNGEGTELWLKQVVEDAKLISKIADSKGKVAAFTEFGYSNMKVSGNPDTGWFTRLLNALKSDPDAKRMAYMLTWANFSPEGSFTPFRDHRTYGNHELLDDFIAYYNDSYTGFNREVSGAYDLEVKTTKEDGIIHTASPTDKATIKNATTTIRVRAVDSTVSKVAYSVEGSEKEYTLKFNAKENYYMADWQPKASQNGKTVQITVKAYLGNKVVYEEPISVNVEARDVVSKTYDFESSVAGMISEGTYPESISMELSHDKKTLNNGTVRLAVNIPDATQTWQELKLKMENLELTYVNKMRYDVYLQIEGNESATIQGIATVPPNSSEKYGMGQSKRLADLEKVKIGNDVYGKYTAEIDFSTAEKLEAATELGLSIVTSNLNYQGPIYVDHVQLLNDYKEPVLDPLVVDDFEVYNGSNAKLDEKYTVASQGDPIKLSLDQDHKDSGDYGLKYEYNLGGSGYGGVTKILGGVDWSEQNTLQFWYTPDGNDQKLVIQVKANDVSFEAYPSLAGDEPQLIQIPFSTFVVAPWDTSHTGEKLDAVNAKKVQEFSIYVNAKEPGTNLSSVLYFDDIRVITK